MTRENVIARCKKISASYNENSVCRFSDNAKNEAALGFIDTSQGQNGARGIVFLSSRAILNFDGKPCEIPYRRIKGLQIISSFEDVYADELTVLCGDLDVRISDCSLNKSELKSLLEELCEDDKKAREHKRQAEKLAEIIADNLAENSLHTGAPTIISEPIPERVSRKADESIPEKKSEVSEYPYDIPETETPVISETVFSEERKHEAVAEAVPEDITETVHENIPEAEESSTPEKKESWISGDLRTRTETAVLDKPEPPKFSFETVGEDEAAERMKIQNMSPEETISYLAQSFSEINEMGNSAEDEEGEIVSVGSEMLMTLSDFSTPAPEEEPDPNALTVEPIWGDIYIKASRNLRELCESGRLTMEQIETELQDKLLDSARAFAEVTGDGAKVPKVLIPKITELKAAAYNFDQYFQMGEDIAVRSMFFMLYQMLSYADRIAETPETKERLNDFFRRFGPAGITLSMLDMRV